MKCVICGDEINKNHFRKHNIFGKDYYDKHIKTGSIGFCLGCKMPTEYINFKMGYRKRCITCSNIEIGKNKIIKTNNIKQLHKINKKCIICGNYFVTDDRINKDICNSKKCRKYSPTEPKKIYDIKFINQTECPYCGIFCKKLVVLYNHLFCHFPYNEIDSVFEYLWEFVWKLNKPTCKNPQCNNVCEREKLNTFKNFCSECKSNSKFQNGGAIKYILDDEQFSQMIEKRKMSSRKFYDNLKNNPEKLEKFKQKWECVGRKNSFLMKKFNMSEIGKRTRLQSAKKQSITMKQLIADGKFTPNITNSWTRWNAYIIIDGVKIKFRSSWEACFYLCNQNLLYEKFRIPYTDKNLVKHITIVDFWDKQNNILYEIKPKSVYITQKNKIDAVIEYCLKNNIKFIWINQNNILNYIDKTKFFGDNKIQYDKMMRGIEFENKHEIDKNN